MARNKAVNIADFSDNVLEQAINWQVKLLSGIASPELHQACDRWRTAHPDHDKAWLALQQLDGVFTNIAPQNSTLALHTLGRVQQQAGASRRKVLKMLLLGSVITPAAAIHYQQRINGADYVTSAGQKSRHQLPDGSVLTLSSRSAADVITTAQGVQVVLRQGDIHLDTRPRFDSERETQIQADNWRINLKSGDYLIHQREQQFYVHARQGEMQINHPWLGAVSLSEQDGGWWLNDEGWQPYTDHFFDPTGWLNGALVAKKMPLQYFINELGRFRSGWLRCDPQIQNLLVSGVFQVADTDSALEALAQSLPVRISKFTPYLVSITPA